MNEVGVFMEELLHLFLRQAFGAANVTVFDEFGDPQLFAAWQRKFFREE